MRETMTTGHEQPITALQREVDAWAARYWGGEYWPPHANLARLAEEVGEVARAINQSYGPKRVKHGEGLSELAGELADALFALLCIANSTGVDLQQAFDITLKKYQVRDEEPPVTGGT